MGVSRKHNIQFPQAIPTWDEAMHLGNGLLGALIWGDGHPLKVSFNRTDLWDLRPIPEFDPLQSPNYSYEQLRRWREAGNVEAIQELYEVPYGRPYPTKIPAGRLELDLAADASGQTWRGGEMVLGQALALGEFGDGSLLQAFVHAQEPIGCLRVVLAKGDAPPAVHLIAPEFAGENEKTSLIGVVQGSLAQLGYAAPTESSGEDWKAFEQAGAVGFRFAVYVGWRRHSDVWDCAWTVASSFEGKEPLELARHRVEAALGSGFDTLLTSHVSWWDLFWNRSSISLPEDPLLERLWHAEQYRFGSASRRGAPPITLQGPWTADEGKLPPWKGDYHHDLNTQLSYWPAYTGNHLEEGMAYLDWLWQTRAENIRWTRRWWDKPGLNVPGVADFAGRPLGGWVMYSFSATTSCWLAQHFYLHWRYSLDDEFLRERAYPYLHEVATFVEAVTELDGEGKRYLPLSSAPEINDNRLDAWFEGTTNHDLALMRWLLSAAAELAGAARRREDADRWLALLAEFPELSTGDNGQLLMSPGVPPRRSHRHLSWLMPIFPLGTLAIDDGDEAAHTIRASLDVLRGLGTSEWCGFAYAWHGNMLARVRDGEGARRALEIFATAFVLPNGFHVNGDQTGTRQFSDFEYRPFTLEGNFAAAAGVQEMLLQSARGVIRVFPAVPENWKNVAFRTLRAEGAFLVSAIRENGVAAKVEILSEKGGLCRLISPWTGQEIELLIPEGQSQVLTEDPA